MKKVFVQLFTCCLCLHLFFNGQSQEVYQGLKQTIDMTLNKSGNADIDVSMSLNAGQWDNFKKSIGNNVSLIKRSMERALPKYYLTDFSYTEQPMERSYQIKFRALGICSMNQNGVWEAKLDTKKPDITKLSNQEFIMTEDVLSNGSLVQQTIKLHLPSVAKDAKVEKDSFGKAELTYHTGQDILSKSLTALGILLIVAGGWWYFKSFQRRKGKTVLTPIRVMETLPTEEEKKQAMRNAEIEARESEGKEIKLKE